jgi:hypothetical protein
VTGRGVQICAVLSRCRTGSTTLTRSISSNEYAIAYPEVLNGIQRHSYQNFLLELVARDEEAKAAFLSQGPLFAFKRYIYSLIDQAVAEKPGLRFFTFECKIENMFVFSSQWTVPALNFDAIELLQQCIDVSDVILFLRRRNVLERYCSDRAAQETGVFHSDMGSQEEAAGTHPMRFTVEDVPQMVGTFEQQVEFDNLILTYIQDKKPDTMLVDYEHIYKNNRFTPEFLTIFSQISDGVILGQPALGKVRFVPAREMIDNYKEVEAAIRTSPTLAPLFAD